MQRAEARRAKLLPMPEENFFPVSINGALAVDIFQNIRGKEYEDAFMKKVAKIAKSKKVGLSWGGDWKSPVDTPHFYLGKWGSTPSLLKKKYGSFSEFQKEWAAVTKKNCKLWKQKKFEKSKKIKKVPAGSKVAVLYVSKLGYAKIRYQGKYGIFSNLCPG